MRQLLKWKLINLLLLVLSERGNRLCMNFILPGRRVRISRSDARSKPFFIQGKIEHQGLWSHEDCQGSYLGRRSSFQGHWYLQAAPSLGSSNSAQKPIDFIPTFQKLLLQVRHWGEKPSRGAFQSKRTPRHSLHQCSIGLQSKLGGLNKTDMLEVETACAERSLGYHIHVISHTITIIDHSHRHHYLTTTCP